MDEQAQNIGQGQDLAGRGGVAVPSGRIWPPGPGTAPRPPEGATSPPAAPHQLRQGDINALQRTAEAAYQRARGLAKDRGWQVLDRDLAVTRSKAASLQAVPQGFPDLNAIAQHWRDAKARWDHAAEHGVPPEVVANAVASRQGSTPTPPVSQAPRIIAVLAGRGISLGLNADGEIVAAPAPLLNPEDRALIKGNLAELKRLLSASEIIK